MYILMSLRNKLLHFFTIVEGQSSIHWGYELPSFTPFTVDCFHFLAFSMNLKVEKMSKQFACPSTSYTNQVVRVSMK